MKTISAVMQSRKITNIVIIIMIITFGEDNHFLAISFAKWNNLVKISRKPLKVKTFLASLLIRAMRRIPDSVSKITPNSLLIPLKMSVADSSCGSGMLWLFWVPPEGPAQSCVTCRTMCCSMCLQGEFLMEIAVSFSRFFRLIYRATLAWRE